MKKLCPLAAGFALLQVTGWAALCTPGSLASYIAMGPAGCVLGNLTVSGFAYKAAASGGAAEITADQITVTPMLAPAGTFGLMFAASWSVESGQKQGSHVIYHVASPTASIQVQQVRLNGDGFQAGMFGSVVVNEALGTTAATQSLQVFLKCTEICRSQTSTELTVTPPAGGLVVADRVTLQSKLGAAAMTSFTDWLVVCMVCV